MNNTLRSAILESSAPLVIYGAGDCGREVLALMRRHNREVVCFLDRTPRVSEIDGVPVLAFATSDTPPGVMALMALFNPETDTLAVKRELEDRGCRAVPFVELHRALDGELRDRYWLENAAPAVPPEAYDLWADEPSRALFDAIVRYREWGDAALLLPSDEDNQYFPRDLPQWSEALARPLRFVDCGAYDGDTLGELAQRAGRGEFTVQAIAAFEPDAVNFNKMTEIARRDWPQIPVLAWPCGVWEQNETLHFSGGTGSSSALQESGESVVQCVKLDEALHGFAPTVIKMDIEGAEPAALAGARRLIEAHRPALAVCAYHRADHLWSIAQQMRAWDCGYHFFLRGHGQSSFETVLYAVAE